jgi:AmmeMemoRadiSam system protein B
MKRHLAILLILIISISCQQRLEKKDIKFRQVVDTIGFAKYDWQMDSIMNRLANEQDLDKTWRVAISPHDDYAYVGDLYPKILNGIKAKTIIVLGVAHKARNFNLENKLIFDSFNAWSAPYGNVQVSDLRNEIINKLPDSLRIVHNDMHRVEHSIEALIPFIQYNNRELEIIPVLVPYMSFEKMQQIAKPFTEILSNIMFEKNLKWGEDVAILITTDAVHYGDEGWGEKNYASYGTDSLGLIKARNHEMEIIKNCLIGNITEDKIQQFVNYTVQESDYKEYKWTWCGRYSVPFGLLTAIHLSEKMDKAEIKGEFIGYTNSIDHPVLKVDDLNMGTTAPANDHHWVGYAAVGYE